MIQILTVFGILLSVGVVFAIGTLFRYRKELF